MKRSLSWILKNSILLSLCGALTLFLSEWLLSRFYAEINVRTYLFFLAMYVPAGVFGGLAFGFVLKLIFGLLRSQRWGMDRSTFLPAVFLGVYFYLYGFYYINEKLTARVDALAPLSLFADVAYLVLTLVVFRLALSFPHRARNGAVQFLEMAFLPLSLLVAVNLRFFAWQPPWTQTGELFAGVLSFGAAGVGGVGLSLVLARYVTKEGPAARRYGILALSATAIFAGFIISGAPSAASFDRVAGEFVDDHPVRNPKNVIWIVTDTARRDHISLYGASHHTTPNLDRFAQDAVVFDRAISAAPWTLPSHASMFTGMFPSKHGAHFVGDAMFSTPLVPENVTVAEILSAHGYKTAGIVANNAGLSRQLGCHQGFQYYFDGRPLVFSLFWGKVLLSLPDDFRVDELWVNEVCLASEMEPLINCWLDENGQDGPFFLFVNLMEPHGGIAFIPEPYDSMYGFDRERQVEVFKDFDADKVVFFQAEVSAEHREFWQAYVHRKITFMDVYLGRLFDKLKEMGLYDDALIIVNSDHGELFGEHHSFGHNTDLYNDLIWVPMMIKYPNGARTGHTNKLVQTVDLMPEILSQLGIQIPPDVQGQPIDEANHPVIAELFQQQHNAHAKRSPGRYYRDLKAIFGSVAQDSLKYIWASNDQSELFDLTRDPRELKNIIAEKPAAVDTLQRRLERWVSSFQPVETNGVTRQTDKEELEKRLRSLGYIK